jgi:hypothetical protein
MKSVSVVWLRSEAYVAHLLGETNAARVGSDLRGKEVPPGGFRAEENPGRAASQSGCSCQRLASLEPSTVSRRCRRLKVAKGGAEMEDDDYFSLISDLERGCLFEDDADEEEEEEGESNTEEVEASAIEAHAPAALSIGDLKAEPKEIGSARSWAFSGRSVCSTRGTPRSGDEDERSSLDGSDDEYRLDAWVCDILDSGSEGEPDQDTVNEEH